MMISTEVSAGGAVDALQQARFRRDGYVIVPGALSSDEVGRYAEELERVYSRERDADQLGTAGALHLLSATANAPDFAGLLDHPSTFPMVWSVLGWNIHVYHSHLDVHPPLRGPKPHRWEWHQDGGRQNVEIETEPRPRLSVKVAYWLSDVSQPGRGNFSLVPGSHRTNWLDGPPRRDVLWPRPASAIEVCVNRGDAVVFDRRIWHARTDNHSDITRRAAFFGYTYRWIAIRDEIRSIFASEWYRTLSPIQQQLLGGVGTDDGDHRWGHCPDRTPLYGYLKNKGSLDPANPALRG